MPAKVFLKVGIIEAKDLRNADSGKINPETRRIDLSDPFCRANCNISDDGVQQTRCLDDTLSPVWNDNFQFLLIDTLDGGILEVWVLDKDTFFDDDLGRVEIPLKNLKAGKQHALDRWFDLTLDDDTKKGQIHLTIELVKKD